MLAIHRLIKRCRRHRWLCVLAVILLVVVAFGLAFHALNDAAGTTAGPATCVLLGFVLMLVIVVIARCPPQAAQPAATRGRSPPRTETRPLGSSFRSHSFLPLRT